VTKVEAFLAIANNVFLQCVVSTVFGNFTRRLLCDFLFSLDLVKKSIQGLDCNSRLA